MMSATDATERDWWSFYDLDHGREVPCENVGRFLAFLHSPGTRNVNMGFLNPSKGTVTMVVFGPRADDGEFVNLRYVLSAKEVRGFSEEDKRLMLTRLRALWGVPSGPNHPLILFRHAMGLSSRGEA